jgi:hypothetical protein
MKHSLLILAVLCGVASAQLFTNNVSVIYTQAQRDTVQAQNDLDNNLRTNGLAPYTNVQPALTLLQYFSTQSGVAFETQAASSYQQREAEFLAKLRAATPAKRIAAMNAALVVLNN